MSNVNIPTAPLPQIRAFMADEHQLVAEGITHLLKDVVRIVRIVNTGEQLLHSIRAAEPDLVISELSLPDLEGVEAMRIARSEGYVVPFLFLTSRCEPRLAAGCIRAGANGFVPKTADRKDLLQAIESVRSGQKYLPMELLAPTEENVVFNGRKLTRTQLEIVDRLALGLRAKEIAFQMGLSTRTVESHKYVIMQIFGVHGTLELIARAKHEGLLGG